MTTSSTKHRKKGASSFEEMFGLRPNPGPTRRSSAPLPKRLAGSGSGPSPSPATKKAARRKKAKAKAAAEIAKKKTAKAKAKAPKKVARPKKAAKAPKKVARPKKAAKKKAAKAKACQKRRRCPPSSGIRFELRRFGAWTGIFDNLAGTGDGRRGRFVKRADQECKAERGEDLQDVFDAMLNGERPEAERQRRGPYEMWRDSESSEIIVYDRRSANLLGETFTSFEEAADWISSGGARDNTCPPTNGLSRRSNPGDGYLTGEVVDLDRRANRGGARSIEQRVTALEDRVDRADVRITRVEGAAVRALGMISGKTPRRGLGDGGQARRAPRAAKRTTKRAPKRSGR